MTGVDPRPHLLEATEASLLALLADEGVDARPVDVRRWLARNRSPGEGDRPYRTAVPRRVDAAARRVLRTDSLEVVERAEDPADGFVKYLFRLDDGALVEAVRIPLHRPGTFTVCVSSQAGCAMQCDFCATGRLGLTRHLEPWEMVAQVKAVRDDAPGTVTGVVFMGQGEPFHNYDRVLRAAYALSDPCNGRIAGSAITISTVGLVPRIRQYAREKHPFRLIVSLTSAVEERRRRLLPVASRWSLEELAGALREVDRHGRGRVTVAWVLMGGVNHDAAEVENLRRLLGDLPLRVNLIDVNDPRPGGYRRATDAERGAFLDALQVLRAPLVRRYSGGTRAHAACGMLASKVITGSTEVAERAGARPRA